MLLDFDPDVVGIAGCCGPRRRACGPGGWCSPAG